MRRAQVSVCLCTVNVCCHGIMINNSLVTFLIKNYFFLEKWLGDQKQLLLTQRTWVQFQASTWWLTTIYSSSSRVSNTLFWPLRAGDTHAVPIPTWGSNTHLKKKCFYMCCACMWKEHNCQESLSSKLTPTQVFCGPLLDLARVWSLHGWGKTSCHSLDIDYRPKVKMCPVITRTHRVWTNRREISSLYNSRGQGQPIITAHCLPLSTVHCFRNSNLHFVLVITSVS